MWLRRGALGLLYLVYLLVLVEVTARIFFAVPALSARISAPDGLSWRRLWVSQHAARGEITSVIDQYDATLGWRTRPDIRNMRVFGNKVLNTNSDGFRGAHDVARQKDSTRRRILLLGDSFTFGEEVSDDETFASQLGQMLPGVEILNVGVHGYGHDQMLILLQELGVKYQPDVVMLGFISSDMFRNTLHFRSYAKPWFSVEHDTLVRHGTPVPTIAQSLRWDWARPRTVDLFSSIRYTLTPGRVHYARRDSITAALLRQMIRVTTGIGAVPVFVYLPIGAEIAASASPSRDEVWFNEACRTMATVKCMSTRPAFAAQSIQGVRFKTTGHWDPAGHRTVAEAIARFLADSNLAHR